MPHKAKIFLNNTVDHINKKITSEQKYPLHERSCFVHERTSVISRSCILRSTWIITGNIFADSISFFCNQRSCNCYCRFWVVVLFCFNSLVPPVSVGHQASNFAHVLFLFSFIFVHDFVYISRFWSNCPWMEFNCCDQSIDWYFDNGKLYSKQNRTVFLFCKQYSIVKLTGISWQYC